MGRRRAGDLCASLILSSRAGAPRSKPCVRHASDGPKHEHTPLNRPVREGFHIGWNESTQTKELAIRVGIDSNQPRPKSKQNSPPHPHVAVLGGGLTGLTTAFYLAKKLPPTSKIVVYEAGNRWGGWIKSQRKVVKDTKRGGDTTVLFEQGPRLVSLAPSQKRLDKVIFVDIVETLGLMPIHPPGDLPKNIWYKGMRQTNSLRDILTAPAFWQAALEVASYRLKKVFTSEETVMAGDHVSAADVVHHKSGSRTVVDVALSALMHGTWGGDPYKLSAISAVGGLYESIMTEGPEFQFKRLQLLQSAPPGSFYYPKKEYEFAKRFLDDLKGEGRIEGFMNLFARTKSTMAHVGPHGLESLPLGLADMLESAPNVELRLGSPVQQLGYSEQRSKMLVHQENGKPDEYDKVISTLPAPKLAKITEGKLPLDEFNGVTIMTVNLWYPEDTHFRGVGYLIPASTPHHENPERGLGVFFDSCAGIGEKRDTPLSIFEDKEKKLEKGTKLFVLMGGHLYDRDGVKPPSPDEAIEQAKSLVQRHMGIPSSTPCHAVANLAEGCLPQHNVGHYQRLTDLHEALNKQYESRLAVAGGSFTKPGVVGALRAGYDVADVIANDDFLATGLEDYLSPEVLAENPPTIVNGEEDNDVFVELIGGKSKGS